MSIEGAEPVTAEPDQAWALVPKLRFPEFRNTGEWSVRPLSALAERKTKRNSDEAIVRVLTNSAERGVVDQKDYFEKDIAVQGNLETYFIIDVGDYVYNPRVSSMAPVGPIGKNRVATGVVSPLYTVFGFDRGDDDFYEHYFRSAYWHGYLRHASNSGARHDRMAISNDAFMEMPLPTPSSDEQQKIADCLSSLDALIAAEGERLAALKVHKKGLMQKLFPAEGETNPRLRFPEFAEAEDWEIKALGQLARNLDNRRVPVASGSRASGVFPYYGASGIVDFVDGYIFDEDVLCVSEDGANLVSRSTPIAFSVSGKCWVNNHAHVLRFEKMHIQILVEQYLNAVSLHDFLTGMAQPKLNRAMLDVIPVPIPTGELEQEKVADCLSSLDALIAAEGERLAALQLHKSGLMNELFASPDEANA